MIFFINFLKLSDSFKFFKNLIASDSNFESFNFKIKSFDFKTSFFENAYKKIFVIIKDIKCLFER